MANRIEQQVRAGMDVFDANDEKVGTVAESTGGYLRVPSGFLGLGQEHSIPLSAIRRIEGEQIQLKVAKDQLDELEAADGDLADEDDGAPIERTTTTTTTTAVEPPMRQEPATQADEADRTLQLREEELTARTHAVQSGEVKLSKDVVAEQQTLEVPVTREEVTIERHPVEPRPSERPISETGETIRVPVHEEQVTAEKQAVVYEEVEVGKRAVQATEHVSDTIRREEAVIEKQGAVDVENGAAEGSRSARRS